jgi:hypothetical protein
MRKLLSLLLLICSVSYGQTKVPVQSLNPIGSTVGQAVLSNGPSSPPTWQTLSGSGTVTAVGLSLPNIFTISGSPVTTSGTLTGALANQSPNLMFASPNGSTGMPTFRSIVAGDVPTLNQNTTGSAGSANAINSATTTVNVSSATAPTNGQVLTATSGTTATWQTAAGGGNVTGPGASTVGFFPEWNNVGGTLLQAGLAGPSSGSLAGSALPLTWTAKQSFTGSTSVEATALTNAAELVNVIALAPAATQNHYLSGGAVQYLTANATANWTINWAWSAGTTLNTAMTTGDSVTTVMVTTQGGTAYFANAFTVDGTSVTPKWQGGTAPAAGDINSLDAYTCTIIKTAANTYTILCALTQYK